MALDATVKVKKKQTGYVALSNVFQHPILESSNVHKQTKLLHYVLHLFP